MPFANHIGTLKEKSLHAALKDHYAQDGDDIEVYLDGYQIDIKHGSQLIEIQTRNFSAIQKKLSALLSTHRILLVHPVAQRKWIARYDKDGAFVSRRKSPKRGRPEELFRELVRIPHLLSHPGLCIEVIMIDMEERWKDDGNGSWRRGKWSIQDRSLLQINQQIRLETMDDFTQFIPNDLPKPFTIKQLATSSGLTRNLAGKLTYTLRKMGILEVIGKQGNAYLLNFS